MNFWMTGQTNPEGGFKHFLFSSVFGEMIQFDSYFSDGLVQPPTRNYHQSLTFLVLRNCLQDLTQRIVCNRIPSHWSLRPHVKEGPVNKNQRNRAVTLVDGGKLMDSQKCLSGFI